VTEQPKYHCDDCKREGITDPLVSWRRHQERKNRRSANILVPVIAVVIVGLVVGAVAAALAVFG
jgi:hypothetical protein